MVDLVLLSKGRCGKVYITPDAERAFKKIFKHDIRTREGMKKRISQYTEYGRKYFNETQFKREGKYPKGAQGGGLISVYVFKYNQARLYGCIDENGNIFICISSDKKQQDKADQEKLRMVAKKYAALVKA